MKPLIILSGLLLGAAPAVAQEPPQRSVGLYAVLGVNEVKPFCHAPGLAPLPDAATSIGAGYSWRQGKFLVGTEFHVLNRQKSGSDDLRHFSGFDSGLLFGYRAYQSNGWSVYPTLGVSLSQSRFSVSDKKETQPDANRSYILQQKAVLLQPGLTVEKVNEAGMLMGLTVGYNAPPAGSASWELQGATTGAEACSLPSGFYVQFKTGGLIKLGNK